MRGDELPEAERPEGVMPLGVFGFRIEGLELGETVEVTFFLPEPLPTETRWYQWDPVDGIRDISTRVHVAESIATLTLTDGGGGDADGLANGAVVDPSGPLLPPAASSGASPEETAPEAVGSPSGGGGGGCFLQCLSNPRFRR